MDLYKLLGVRKSAKPEVIRRAFRLRAKMAHPDHNPGDEGAAEKFRDLQMAFEVLWDAERRKRYDETGEFDRHRVVDDLRLMGQVLSELLQAVIAGVVQQGGDVRSVDLVAKMREAIRYGQGELRKTKGQLEKMLAGYKAVVERLKVKGDEPNILVGAAKQMMVEAEGNLRGIAAKLEQTEKAWVHLNACSFAFARTSSQRMYAMSGIATSATW